jgi:NADPH:quinone reductase-like Zn-dependent oxidoreductase
VVDELGEGVRDVALGDRVFGLAVGSTAAAELALLAAYAPIPPPLDFTHAAALPMAIETATRCLELLDVSEHTTLLINGAAGAVGSSAVQLARARDAHVIGTASPGNHDYLRSLGAEPTTYGDGLEQRVRAIAPDGIDAALDAAGGDALPALVNLAGGPDRVVTIADPKGAQHTGVRWTGGPGTKRAVHVLTDIAPLIEAGQFRLPVQQTFKLEQIGEAHRLSESGHVQAKLVVLVD